MLYKARIRYAKVPALVVLLCIAGLLGASALASPSPEQAVSAVINSEAQVTTDEASDYGAEYSEFAPMSSTGDTWSVRTPMPTERSLLAAATADGIVYAIGGVIVPHFQTANEAYDPSTDSWTIRAPMPTARMGLAAEAVNGIVYAIGGEAYEDQGVVYSKNEAYDPATDSWSTRTPMPTARHGLAAVAVDGIVYAIGGWDGSSIDSVGSAVSVVEAYDPQTDSWTSRSLRPTAGSVWGVGVVGGIIYTFGPGTAVEAYNPDTDSWSTRAPVPTERYSFNAGAVDNFIYVVGGGEPGTNDALGTNEAYHPATDSWQTRNPMHSPRFSFAAATTHGRLYVFGGFSHRDTDWYSTEFYTPPSDAVMDHHIYLPVTLRRY